MYDPHQHFTHVQQFDAPPIVTMLIVTLSLRCTIFACLQPATTVPSLRTSCARSRSLSSTSASHAWSNSSDTISSLPAAFPLLRLPSADNNSLKVRGAYRLCTVGWNRLCTVGWKRRLNILELLVVLTRVFRILLKYILMSPLHVIGVPPVKASLAVSYPSIFVSHLCSPALLY